MGTLTSESLWPAFSGPADLVEVERVPLGERGLPASTYELVRRAAELWPDRQAVDAPGQVLLVEDEARAGDRWADGWRGGTCGRRRKGIWASHAAIFPGCLGRV